jgi:Zn-dependent protease with chaperone function
MRRLCETVSVQRLIHVVVALIALVALAGCAGVGRESTVYGLRRVDDIRATPDPALERVVPIVRALAAAAPLPVEALQLYSSSDATRLKLFKDEAFPANNASVVRCGPKGATEQPWGCVVIGDRLLAEFDDAALAGVLAHELGHLERGHAPMKTAGTVTTVVSTVGHIMSYVPGPIGWAGTAMSLGSLGAQGVMLKYSRDQEREADDSAVKRLAAADYCAGPTLRETFDALARLASKESAVASGSGITGLWSTHPSLEERWKTAGTSCSSL